MIKHCWLNSICFKFNTTTSNSTDLNSALHEEVYVDFCRTLYCNFGKKNAYHFHGMFCHDFQVPQCYKLSVHIFCRLNFAFLHQTPIPLTHLSVSYQYRFQKNNHSISSSSVKFCKYSKNRTEKYDTCNHGDVSEKRDPYFVWGNVKYTWLSPCRSDL